MKKLKLFFVLFGVVACMGLSSCHTMKGCCGAGGKCCKAATACCGTGGSCCKTN